MCQPGRRVLILCYGNPGRLDDGLGAAFGREFEKFLPQGFDIEIDMAWLNSHSRIEEIKPQVDQHTLKDGKVGVSCQVAFQG